MEFKLKVMRNDGVCNVGAFSISSFDAHGGEPLKGGGLLTSEEDILYYVKQAAEMGAVRVILDIALNPGE